ncbi:unnamed protein product, partial [Brachionus calyciflorus]
FINDLSDVLDCFHLLYADGVKLISTIKSNEYLDLQRNLENLTKWTYKWGMDLNLKKCKGMHLGKRNPNFEYSIIDMEGTRHKWEDQVDLKWEDQVNIAVNKSNRALGMLKNSFKYFNKKSFKMLYSALVRPNLEYAVSVWSPFFKKDVNAMESIQRRATKLVKNIREMPYELRLKELEIQPLVERRERGDLIQIFKIAN